MYRRTWRRKDGTKVTSGAWWITAIVDGRQVCKTSGTKNKRLAQQREEAWRTEVAQGQYSLLRKAPILGEWAARYLESVNHPSTERRYRSSMANLLHFFGEARLDHISVARIAEFKRARRQMGVKAATVNRDLRFLAQILKQAERERFIGRSPFDLTKFFVNEARDRRKPHILTWGEQEKVMAMAAPKIRALLALGTETGMRKGEMLALKWTDIDLLGNSLQVEKSKSRAGLRRVPLTNFCKSELLRWRNLAGPDFSEFVFPSFSKRRHPLKGERKAWKNLLEKAGIPFFPLSNLRHTFATRLTAGGTPENTIAHMLGHSSTQIVPRYSQPLDQNRLEAVRRLEALRQSTISDGLTPDSAHPVVNEPANRS